MINLFNKIIIGLSISDNVVNLAEVKKQGKGVEIINSSNIILKPGIVENGRIKDKEQLLLVVKQALSQAKPKPISSEKIVFILPQAQTYIVNFSIKKEEKILEYAFSLIPLEKDSTIFSYASNKTQVVFVAVDKKVIEEWQKFFQELKLKIDFFDIASFAKLRGLNFTSTKNLICIIEIDNQGANIDIGNQQNLIASFFIKSIDSKQIIQAVNQKMQDIGQPLSKIILMRSVQNSLVEILKTSLKAPVEVNKIKFLKIIGSTKKRFYEKQFKREPFLKVEIN